MTILVPQSVCGPIYRSNRYRDSFRKRHLLNVKAMLKAGFWYAGSLAPLHEACAHAIMLNDSIRRFISRLLFPCGPFYVTRLIISVVVNSIDSMEIGRPGRKILDKVFVDQPVVAHRDPSAPIVFPLSKLRIFATPYDVLPDVVQRVFLSKASHPVPLALYAFAGTAAICSYPRILWRKFVTMSAMSSWCSHMTNDIAHLAGAY